MQFLTLPVCHPGYSTVLEILSIDITLKLLFTGIWKSKKELKNLRKIDRDFHPDQKTRLYYKDVFENWRRVADRFKNWYKSENTEVDD